MMSRRLSPPVVRDRPRSDSHLIGSQRGGGIPSETDGGVPTRPPRNPARPATFCEEQPVATTASEDVDYRSERGREIGEERYGPSVNVPPPKSLVNTKQSPPTTPPPQINTLDRKILQELKQSMLARSAQFALKNGIKHHPFSSDEVPYPRSYHHKCIDTDVWETLYCEQLCGDVTFHSFDVPPTKVLDLGCGSGSWIMSCARRWKKCHFVGLDIVPLHPDLGQLELSKRVKWVQANFLERLPFQNEEFDFVHIKRIARGVPEDKWDALFEEIIRVMKPGAALEMLEEDLYIPGQVIDPADNDSPLSANSSSGSSEARSQFSDLSISDPSASLPDIFAAQGSSNSQMVRRSMSERTSRSSVSRSPTTPPPPVPVHAVFPRPRKRNTSSRPIPSYFNLNKVLQKRSGRDDGAGTDGERPRKSKKKAPPPSSGPGLYPLSVSGGSIAGLTMVSGSSVASNKNSTKKAHRPPSPAGRDHPSTSPSVGNTNGKSELDLLQNQQSEESRQARARALTYPTLEDDGQRKYSANRELEPFALSTVGMHDHAQQVRSSHTRNSRSSGVLTDTEPIEPNRLDRNLTAAFPAPPPLPKGILGRSEPQTIPSSLSSNEVSSSANGISWSAPDRLVEDFDRTGHQLPSPTLDVTASKPRKALSTSSLGVYSNHSTDQVPPLPQNARSNYNLGSDNTSSIHSPKMDGPPNPRQHKLLEVIHSEMHAARFVNLAPLSLLENYVRTYFRSVRTHAPLTFTFPPPPGCDHRPEFDAVELQLWELNRTQNPECHDDQDHLGPDSSPSISPLSSSPSIPQLNRPPRPTREGTPCLFTGESGRPRARSSGTKPTRPFTADPRAANHRQPRPSDSKNFLGVGDVLSTGASEYAMMNTSTFGGSSSTRATKAAKESQSSASEEWERSRQRGDPLFTRSNGVRGKGEGGEGRKKLHVPASKLTRPSTAGSLPPPSSFGYNNPGARSSSSLTPSMASSSSSTSTIIQRDPGTGKRGLTVAERAQSSPLPNKKAEIDVRSLNLHLRVRVAEILGCTEAMWDWVKELQRQEAEKERKHKEQMAAAAAAAAAPPPKAVRVGGGRVSYRHHERPRASSTRQRMNSVGSDPSLRHKRSTRGLATGPSRKRSGDDGQSLDGESQRTFVKVSGGTAESPSSYFTTSFGSVSTENPSELTKDVKRELLHLTRERFEEVLSWFQFDMDDSIRLTRSMATRTPCMYFGTNPTEHRRSFDAACKKLETYLQQHPRRPASLKSTSTANGNWAAGGSPQHSQHSDEELCCLPPLLNLVHPSKRLCRTIRVWVAWKP